MTLKGDRNHSMARASRKEPPEDRPRAAGIPRRIAAIVYDALLIIGLLFPVTLVLLWIKGGSAFASDDPYYKGAIALTIWGFYIGFWTHGGQTLGMRAWGIAIEKANGDPIDFKRAILHFFLGIGLCLPAGFAWWWTLIHRERRALHEFLSGTRIVLTQGKDRATRAVIPTAALK